VRCNKVLAQTTGADIVVGVDVAPAPRALTAPSATTGEPGLERARGRVGLAVAADATGRQSIADLHQSGCGRFLFPARASGRDPVEAVVVNTGGGLTGGDRFDIAVKLGVGASALVATQACEKIYRARDEAARLTTTLKVGEGAVLRWLPQETILFDRSSLRRSLTIDMAGNADVLAGEAVLLGRQAMGEVLHSAWFHDSWRIRRNGRLVFAEETRVDRDWPKLRASKALLGEGAAAMATIIHAAPGVERCLDSVRAIMESTDIDGGASAFDGLVVMRMVAPSGFALRETLVRLLELCAGAKLPRVWMT
jgi:urease accessory protein